MGSPRLRRRFERSRAARQRTETLANESSPKAEGRGAVALIRPKRIVVICPGRTQHRASEAEQMCQSLHDTFLPIALRFAVPNGRTRQVNAAHREPLTRSTFWAVVHGELSPPFAAIKKTVAAPRRPTVRETPRGWPRHLPQCRALALHNVGPSTPLRASRVRFRLDSAESGHPLGSLDLSGQRHPFVQTPHLTRNPQPGYSRPRVCQPLGYTPGGYLNGDEKRTA